MPDPSEERLTVEFEDVEGNRQVTRVIEAYSLTSDYTIAADGWQFTVYSDDNPAALRREFKPWKPVRLSIGGNLQVIGRIDGIRSAGPNGTGLEVFGRDYLGDIVDCTVDPQFQVKEGMSINALLLELLAPWGIRDVIGTDAGGHGITRNILTGKTPGVRTPTRDFKTAKLSDFKAADEQGVFEYAMEVLGRHGFMMLPANRRDAVVIDEPSYDQDPLYRITRPGNVLTATCVRDYSSVPTVTIARGRTGGGTANTTFTATRREVATIGKIREETTTSIVRQRAQSPDQGQGLDAVSPLGRNAEVARVMRNEHGESVVRDKRFDPRRGSSGSFGYTPPVYKAMFYRDKEARNQEQLERGLKKVVSERLRKTLEYEVTIRGHIERESGACWAVDTIAQVDDEIEDIHERLWIQERTFTNDGSGPMTQLKLIRPESYVL